MIASVAPVTAGGREHDVRFLGSLVLRNTVDGRFGLSGAAPVQYLARLADFNTVFPKLAMKLLGVSLAGDDLPVIWTVQPFVEGVHFTDEAELHAAMVKHGWESTGDKGYRDPETGVELADVHVGNVLVDGDFLYPIDVIVTDLGKIGRD